MTDKNHISAKAAACPFVRESNRELVEFTALVLLGTAVPLFLRRPQILVGSVVNFTLASAALTFSDWRKIVPLILLPSLYAAVSGFLFGPATVFIFYLLPFIWAGNAVYVLTIKKGSKINRVSAWGALPVASALKAAIILFPALALISLGIIPAVLAAAMGWIQFLTALVGGVLAFALIGYFRLKKVLWLVLTISALSVTLFAGTAHAYIDPGTGSYLLQILVAALLGGLFAVKIFWGNIKGFFKRLFSRKSEGRSQVGSPDG